MSPEALGRELGELNGLVPGSPGGFPSAVTPGD